MSVSKGRGVRRITHPKAHYDVVLGKLPKDSLERVGILTGLLDRDGNEIKTGDFARYISCDYDGVVLYHSQQKRFGIFFGMWYGDDRYNPRSYGKFLEIPKDNGARMDIKIISLEQLTYDPVKV